MKISKTPNSRIDTVDFKNLVFGQIFADHILVCEFKNGEWQEPEIKPYGEVPMNYSLHALHYGQAAFEGLKAYRNNKDQISIFRPLDNFKRLNRSAERLLMPQVPEEVFIKGLTELIKLDRN